MNSLHYHETLHKTIDMRLDNVVFKITSIRYTHVQDEEINN